VNNLLLDKWRKFVSSRVLRAPKVSLNNDYILILPSKISLGFIVTLVILSLAAINYQSNMIYTLSFWLLSIFFICALHSHFNLHGLTLENVGCDYVFVGQQCTCNVKISATKRNRPALLLQFAGNKDEQPVKADVDKNSSTTIKLNFTVHQRGYITAPNIKVSSYYPLGLFVIWSYINLDFKTLAYPKPIAGKFDFENSGTDENNENSEVSNQAGSDDFIGLNRYQPGDNLQRIDWKAYSRGLGLQVKHFGTLQGKDPNLDFAQVNGDVEDRLSILCYMVLELSKQNKPFALTLPNKQVAVGSGIHHQKQCLEALALYES